MNNNPLVSIAVITYNSSEYILDGLESVKNQTYKNIELIISDDCSTDDTVKICREWLDRNNDRFVRTELISVAKNTGVAANGNRAADKCQGEWIKFLSGDDQFIPETIEKYLCYIAQHPQSSIVFGKLIFYGPNPEYVKRYCEIYENKYYSQIRLGQHEQYIEYLKHCAIPGPGLIYKRNLWEEIGGFDERYPFCEEHPLTCKILKAGYQIYFLEEGVYRYQVREDSLCRKDNGGAGLSRSIKDAIRYFFDYRRKDMMQEHLILETWNQTLSYKITIAHDQNQMHKMLFYGILKITSPLFYKNTFNFFKNKIIKIANLSDVF